MLSGVLDNFYVHLRTMSGNENEGKSKKSCKKSWKRMQGNPENLSLNCCLSIHSQILHAASQPLVSFRALLMLQNFSIHIHIQYHFYHSRKKFGRQVSIKQGRQANESQPKYQ